MIDVIVDRKRWLRGEGSTDSRLLRASDNKMCCLGFACLKLGAPETSIKDRSIPTSLYPNIFGAPTDLNSVEINTTYNLMISNDAEQIKDAEREALIIKGGKKLGLNFIFEGE